MPRYEVEYSYNMPEWDATIVEAETPEQAEQFATEYVSETYPEAQDIMIETVKELVR